MTRSITFWVVAALICGAIGVALKSPLDIGIAIAAVFNCGVMIGLLWRAKFSR